MNGFSNMMLFGILCQLVIIVIELDRLVQAINR